MKTKHLSLSYPKASIGDRIDTKNPRAHNSRFEPGIIKDMWAKTIPKDDGFKSTWWYRIELERYERRVVNADRRTDYWDNHKLIVIVPSTMIRVIKES